MPDKTDGLALEIARNGDTAMVRCQGKLVAGVDDVLYNGVRQLIPDTPGESCWT